MNLLITSSHLEEVHAAAPGVCWELCEGFMARQGQAGHTEWHQDGATQGVRVAGVGEGEGVAGHRKQVETTRLGLALPRDHLRVVVEGQGGLGEANIFLSPWGGHPRCVKLFT